MLFLNGVVELRGIEGLRAQGSGAMRIHPLPH